MAEAPHCERLLTLCGLGCFLANVLMPAFSWYFNMVSSDGLYPPLSNGQSSLMTNPWSDRKFFVFFSVLRIAFSGGRSATFGGVWGGRVTGPLVGPRLKSTLNKGV